MNKLTALICLLLLQSWSAFSQCPDNLFSIPTNNCHVWNFEVGSAQGNPQVTWYFGDGLQVTTGHFVQHNYLLPGTYTVTAVYTSSTCPNPVTLQTSIVVTCNCTPVSVQFNSELPTGGPSFVQWNIATLGGTIFNQGVCQFANSSPSCSANLCLENGCYTFAITAPNSLNIPSFTSGLTINGMPAESFNSFYNSAGNTYYFSFSVNSNCNNCNLEVSTIQQTSQHVILSASGMPAGAVVQWTQNGVPVSTGNTITFELQQGANEICASYSSNSCQLPVTWCNTYFGPANNACPTVIQVTAASQCGMYTFHLNEFGSFGNIIWSWGDGTASNSGSNNIPHQFTAPGVYQVCAQAWTAECPNGVVVCQTVEVPACNVSCPTSITAHHLGCGLWEFELGSAQQVTGASWFFGDGTLSDSGHYTTHQYTEPGVYTVGVNSILNSACLTNFFSVVIEVETCNANCPTSILANEMACGYYVFSVPYLHPNQWVSWNYTVNNIQYSYITQGDNFITQLFTTPGEYTVCATYHSPLCESFQLCQTIVINNCNPECSLQLSAVQLESGLFEFTAEGYPEEYPMHWNFGDGTTLNATWVTMHQFEPGNYTVCASTTTEACGTQTACTDIHVPESEEPCTNTVIGIDSYVNNGGTPWLVYSVINNQTNSMVLSQQHTYSNTSPYHDFALCLPDGCYTLVIDNNNLITLGTGVFVHININGQSVAYELVQQDAVSFSVVFGINSSCSSNTCEAHFEVQQGPGEGQFYFINTSTTASNAEWHWNFGNGFTASSFNSATGYSAPGQYTVCLEMTTATCSDTYCTVVTIPEPSECDFNLVTVNATGYYSNANLADVVSALMVVNGLPTETLSFTINSNTQAQATFCIPDGCYSLNLSWPQPLLANYIVFTASINGVAINIQEFTQGELSGIFTIPVNMDCTIGISEQESALHIYPNPTSDWLTIELPEQSSSYQLTIMDYSGRTVMHTQSTAAVERLNLSSLASGLYTFVLETTDSRLSQKIQIIR